MSDYIRNDITKHTTQMTMNGLRCIGVCYKDIPKDAVKFDDAGKIMDDPECYPE